MSVVVGITRSADYRADSTSRVLESAEYLPRRKERVDGLAGLVLSGKAEPGLINCWVNDEQLAQMCENMD